MKIVENWKHQARQLKIETYALYLAYKDPRTPWYAKILAACVVGYAFSPIDLIPDPIPVLGYLDDLVLVPAGVFLALRMIPPPVMEDCRRKAAALINQRKPVNRVAAVFIVMVWLAAAALVVMVLVRMLAK